MGGGGGWSYDYSVSLSPNLWIMTFLIQTWTLDFGLTIMQLTGGGEFGLDLKCEILYFFYWVLPTLKTTMATFPNFQCALCLNYSVLNLIDLFLRIIFGYLIIIVSIFSIDHTKILIRNILFTKIRLLFKTLHFIM